VPQSQDSAQSHCLCVARVDPIENDCLPEWSNDFRSYANTQLSRHAKRLTFDNTLYGVTISLATDDD